MALTERTRIREILIVQNDVTLTWAAHQVPITEVLRDGVVVAATYANAQPLSIASIGAVLDPAFISVMNERDAAIDQVADLIAQCAELQDQLDAAVAE